MTHSQLIPLSPLERDRLHAEALAENERRSVAKLDDRRPLVRLAEAA